MDQYYHPISVGKAVKIIKKKINFKQSMYEGEETSHKQTSNITTVCETVVVHLYLKT